MIDHLFIYDTFISSFFLLLLLYYTNFLSSYVSAYEISSFPLLPVSMF